MIVFSILANSKKKNTRKKYIKIQYIGWDSNPIPKRRYLLEPPLGHAYSQRNKTNYDIIILNMFKEKSLSRQSRERVFWQLLIVSC